MFTILITGANKGIGTGLVTEYLARPDTTVIAAVRDPSAKDSQALETLPKGANSRLIVVKIASTSETDASSAVETLRSQDISHLDTVYANAGIFKREAFVGVSQSKTSDFIEHIDVNVGGPLRLFQATLPLLNAAEKPTFVLVSSVADTIGGAEKMPFKVTAYGASKAAANFLLRRIHVEHENVVSIAMHPGAVQTIAGNEGAVIFGFKENFTTLRESIDGMVPKVDHATREESSGKFLSFDDTPMMW
ncbi:hypothetical protein LTR17_019180 [Elasticomyces elasticus]|nr:hypothetical protein LTR17_019180 [Elasticomyces elasticus]